MSNNRLFIFDFDGTISYTGGDIAASLNEVRESYGLMPLATDEVLKYVGYGARFLIENTVNVPGATVESVLTRYKASYFDHCTDTSKPYDGLVETLDALIKRGDSVALFTNKPLKITIKTLDFFGIRDRFNSIYCPENLTARKPDPEGIVKCMADAGVSNDMTVMVGDSKADVDAGKAAGVKTCACLYGMGDVKKLLDSGPDFTINNIRELTELNF